jgi:cyclohexyl-isocyanide hydratase
MPDQFSVVFALFPGLTQLDFTGPLEVFSRLPGADCILASVDGGELRVNCGVTFAGLARMADVEECALLCVPGGFGTIEAMQDQTYLAELRRLAQHAQFVTSVCSGSLLLAAAGLLKGKRAACHWAWAELLTEFGVEHDPARIVRDGNVISGGGVTAGIDMALTVMAEIAGSDHARAVQLALEYAPEPPFDSGRPDRARPDTVALVRKRMDENRTERIRVTQRAAQALAVL